MRPRYLCVLLALVFLIDARAAEAQCTATVTPTSVSVSSIGSTSALSVISGTNCSWNAVSAVNWITVNSVTGFGIGSVNYTVAANTTAAARTGTLTVSGQIVTFTQATGSCTSTVTPMSVSVTSIGSTSAVSVTSGTSCSWTATSAVPWITITGGATGAGIGSVSYVVAANTGAAARTGTLTVAGHTVTFTQAASSCAATVTPSAVTAPAVGSSHTLSVISGTSCAWTASSAVAWIAITAGATGSGIGAVSFTVAPTTTARSGAITVAGQAVTIAQDAPTPPAPPTNVRIIR